MSHRQRVVKKLRTLYKWTDPREKSNECWKLLYELSKCYQHGDKDDKWDFVCRCALLNGALLGCDDDEVRNSIQSDINAMGKILLHNATGKQPVVEFDLVEFSTSMNKYIQLKRDEVAQKLKEWNPLSDEVHDKDEIMTFERNTIAFVRDTMEKTSTYYAETMQIISNKCVEVLGNPPCAYSHFAMGSLARQEITLYSDFENAIILGDGVDWKDATAREKAIEYFRWYAILFDLVLINFGETPINLIGIPGLNDHYSEDKSKNWFKDTFVIRSGIMFDSCLSYACKHPFGRKPTLEKPEGTELILPWNEMLRYLEEHESLKEGYHLTNMLIESRHVAGNEELFQDFRSECLDKARNLRVSRGYMDQELKYTLENLAKFNLTPIFHKMGWAQNAKKAYYRPMSVHIPFIARICGIFECPSTSHIVERLKDMGLSDDATHSLLFAIAMANLSRMKVYSERRNHNDHLSGLVLSTSSTSNVETIFDVVGKRGVIGCYEVGLGLRTSVNEIVKVIDHDFSSIASSSFPQDVVIPHLEKISESRGDMNLRGDIHRQFGDYDEACRCYEIAFNSSKNGNGDEDRRKCEILLSLGLTCLHSKRYKEAVSWYDQLIELEKSQKASRGATSSLNIAMALTMSAHCCIEDHVGEESSRVKGFESYIQKAKDMWNSLLAQEPENKEYLIGLADFLDTEAYYLLLAQDFENSLQKYRQADAAFEQGFGFGNLNDDIIKVKNGIAMCLFCLKRFKEVLKMTDEIYEYERKTRDDPECQAFEKQKKNYEDVLRIYSSGWIVFIDARNHHPAETRDRRRSVMIKPLQDFRDMARTPIISRADEAIENGHHAD